jgi:hypothetical protein
MMATGQELVDGYLQRLAAATADLPPDTRDDLLTDVRTHLVEAQQRATSDAEIRAALDRLGTPEAIAAEARGGPGAPSVSGAWGTTPPPPSGAAWTAPPPPSRAGWVAPPARPRTTSSVGYDVTALLTLVFGAVALTVVLGFVGTFIGWVVGLGLFWSSRTWTVGEKTLGTLVWPGGLAFPFYLALAGGQVCTSESVETVVEESANGTVQTFVEPGSAIAEQCTGFAMPLWLGIPVMIVTFVAPLIVALVLQRRADARRAADRA